MPQVTRDDVAYDETLAARIREMDFTGRPMKAMVFVEPIGLDGDALGEWVTSAAAFAQSLPPKSR